MSKQEKNPFFREAPHIRRTKIVATLGPASSTKEAIGKLIECGVDITRLNFSHGTLPQKKELISLVRAAAAEKGKTVAILQDLQGPKLRVGEMRGGKPVVLKDRSLLTICSSPVFGTSERVYVDCPGLAEAVEEGSPILLSDGSITLKVKSVDKKEGEIVCEVIHGGELYPRKGVNLPGVKLKISSLTKKDREDLAFGVKEGVDWIALSFVREARDIEELRALVNKLYSELENPVNPLPPKLLAKIEKPEALASIAEIVAAADGIMVARGDLGVEMPLSQVPVAQKAIIREANNQGKPVITATQMLESMINAPVATRAEACDVANAVYDGSDCVMLSAETAMGQFPFEAVSFMARVLAETEAAYIEDETRKAGLGFAINGHEIEKAACELADANDTAALVVFSRSGNTVRHCASFRPATPILALCENAETARQLVMHRGLTPVVVTEEASLLKTARTALANFANARDGKKFVLLAERSQIPWVAVCDKEEARS